MGVAGLLGVARLVGVACDVGVTFVVRVSAVCASCMASAARGVRVAEVGGDVRVGGRGEGAVLEGVT